MPTFRINAVGDNNGPSIFGKRLKEGLERKGWVTLNSNPDINIVFAKGPYIKGKLNILRLDNLYFDSENTIGNTDYLNAPIRQAYNSFDKIVFQSKFAVEQYKRHIGPIRAPYKVIYNGVPSTFSKQGSRVEYNFSKTFICSADWRAHKRLEPIIDAFKRFNKRLNYGLIILGDCKVKDSSYNIIYPGKVHHTEIPQYMRGADVGVHISWLDCSPNVVYEMIACGKPVLCSHNGGTKEIVRNDGIVLKLEEDYDYSRVALYKPPIPSLNILHCGMQDILERRFNSNRSDLYIDYVAEEYMRFILT